MGLNAPGVFGLILRPIRMIARQHLIQDQSAGEDVRMDPRHRSAHQMFGRSVIVRANITLESVPRRSLVRTQQKAKVDEFSWEAGANGGSLMRYAFAGLRSAWTIFASCKAAIPAMNTFAQVMCRAHTEG